MKINSYNSQIEYATFFLFARSNEEKLNVYLAIIEYIEYIAKIDYIAIAKIVYMHCHCKN